MLQTIRKSTCQKWSQDEDQFEADVTSNDWGDVFVLNSSSSLVKATFVVAMKRWFGDKWKMSSPDTVKLYQ